MKTKHLLVIISGLFTGMKVQAQDQATALNENAHKGILSRIEFLVGPSLTSFYDGIPPNQVTNIGYSFGVGFLHRIGEKFDLSSKILFERKGNKMDFVETFPDANNIPTT